VLNLGLCEATIEGLASLGGSSRFAADTYQRLISEFARGVFEPACDREPAERDRIATRLHESLAGLTADHDDEKPGELSSDEWRRLCRQYNQCVLHTYGKSLPEDPWDQLWQSVSACFASWNSKRAKVYRRLMNLPGDWGVACTIQRVVFGHMSEDSGAGFASTRNPHNGRAGLFGEWLPRIQGEEVYSGMRRNHALCRNVAEVPVVRSLRVPSLEEMIPQAYRKLAEAAQRLEARLKDMLDIEFVVERGKLFLLQCRPGCRTGIAAFRIATGMLDEGLIDEATAVARVECRHLEDLQRSLVDPDDSVQPVPLAIGSPAAPGTATGRIALTPETALRYAEEALRSNGPDTPGVILLRYDFDSDDVPAARVAAGIVSKRGGPACNAILLARGTGKACVVGVDELSINESQSTVRIGHEELREGDVITLDGHRGSLHAGHIQPQYASDTPWFRQFMAMVDRHRRLEVRSNAGNAEQIRAALAAGADAIGQFRLERMFKRKESDDLRLLLQRCLVAESDADREAAVGELLPPAKETLKEAWRAAGGLPITVRLLNAPVSALMPDEYEDPAPLANRCGMSIDWISTQARWAREENPLMGKRGARLAASRPDLVRMQCRAILEAAAEMAGEAVPIEPGILVPMVSDPEEFRLVKQELEEVADDIRRTGARVSYTCGIAIETPRACLVADRLAEVADFLSFDTYALTQFTWGLSGEACNELIGTYLANDVLFENPLVTIDLEGVGPLIRLAVDKARAVCPDLIIGATGAHAGDPASVDFFAELRLDYLSCDPDQLLLTRLTTAQAHVRATGGRHQAADLHST
jgi:pyruvate,orthophosphate dikinase